MTTPLSTKMPVGQTFAASEMRTHRPGPLRRDASAAAAHHSSSTPITAVPPAGTPATSRSFTAA